MRKADVNGTPTVWIAVNNLSKGSDRPTGRLWCGEPERYRMERRCFSQEERIYQEDIEDIEEASKLWEILKSLLSGLVIVPVP